MQINYIANQGKKDKKEAKKDLFLLNIEGLTVKEVDEYIATNVTKLEDAIAVIRAIMKVLVARSMI